MQNPLTNIYTGNAGATYQFEWRDADTLDDIPQERVTQSYAIAFHGDRFVVVNNIQKPGSYTPVGGTVEAGEHPDETLIREIQEESNMKVLEHVLLGYQKVTQLIDIAGKTVAEGALAADIAPAYYQLRYAAKVEPYGPFVSDPAEKVTEVIMCDEHDYKNYFDWGAIGEHSIARALEVKNQRGW